MDKKLNLKIWDWDYAEDFDSIDCTGGNYPQITLYLDNDETFIGRVCACQNGCSNTLPISKIQWGKTTLGELLEM